MELKFEYQNISLVWDQDLNRFIEHHLGRPWNLQQQGFSGQDTFHTLEVFPDSEATAKVEAWLASPIPEYDMYGRAGEEIKDINTTVLLSELCNRGLLPEGDLYVHVWW